MERKRGGENSNDNSNRGVFMILSLSLLHLLSQILRVVVPGHSEKLWFLD